MLEPNHLFAGRYRILKHLAEGGMGVIFEAEHVATEGRVALKVLWPHVLAGERARQRFELEAKVPARVNSEHIVRVLDAGFEPETRLAYIVMELLAGSTLAEYVEKRGPLSSHLTVELMRQVARGLDAAHGYRAPGGARHPIVHRDLKPENLFLCTRPGEAPLVKILDYGIAKIVRQTASVSRDLRGTPAYMAYEQLAGKGLSPQTDIWLLGLITFFALTGRNYFRAANRRSGMEALFAEILTLPFVRASDRIREEGLDIALPKAFDAWLFGCVAREPSRRFSSAGEAIDALELVLEPSPREGGNTSVARAAEKLHRSTLAYASTTIWQGVRPVRRGGEHSVTGVASERKRGRAVPRRVFHVALLLGSTSALVAVIGAAWYGSTRSESASGARTPSTEIRALDPASASNAPRLSERRRPPEQAVPPVVADAGGPAMPEPEARSSGAPGGAHDNAARTGRSDADGQMLEDSFDRQPVSGIAAHEQERRSVPEPKRPSASDRTSVTGARPVEPPERERSEPAEPPPRLAPPAEAQPRPEPERPRASEEPAPDPGGEPGPAAPPGTEPERPAAPERSDEEGDCDFDPYTGRCVEPDPF